MWRSLNNEETQKLCIQECIGIADATHGFLQLHITANTFLYPFYAKRRLMFVVFAVRLAAFSLE
jgi:hypothetical protein